MIMVTGGAGFIGSNVQAALAESGAKTMVVDWLGSEGKWRNLRHHPPSRVLAPADLPAYLATDPHLDAIIHLGAISETTATDGDLVWHSNVTLSQSLWAWCAARGVRLIYASSAATYGNGAAGFDDEFSTAALARLKPLNLYGWSKHAFDLWVARQVESGAPAPPAWAGLKFFNVYGPNEYHKGRMISVVKVKHDELLATGVTRLFRADQPGMADGAQARDFIYVEDAVAALLFLCRVPAVAGIFNLGTGTARTYADLAAAVSAANGRKTAIEYIEMPSSLRGQYQSFTEAPMARLRAAGYHQEFRTMEAGINDYIHNFLSRPDHYR
jgi:ADP-L-glycero-D-manno-heptose 6-epimerase